MMCSVITGRYKHFNLFALQLRSAFNFQPRFTGNAFADFLLGYPTSTAQGGELLRGNFKQNSSYFFVQDDWKASQKLTVEMQRLLSSGLFDFSEPDPVLTDADQQFKRPG